MIFDSTNLEGVFVIQPEQLEDERGFFARTFCEQEFAKHSLASRVRQCNISYNHTRGTLRGMHFQRSPHAESKLVRCTTGSIYDVVVDLREDSKTYMQWQAFELSSKNHNALYIPCGFAHGFQTLEDQSEVFYQMFNSFHPDSATGIRWNDPAFNIKWPLAVDVISDKDNQYADFDVGLL